MVPKGPISSYFFVNIEDFSNFVVENPAPHIPFNYAIQTLLHHWITKVGPPQYVVTD